MKNLIKIIQDILKWLLKHWIQATFYAILAVIGGVFPVYSILWNLLKVSLQLQTPLLVSIILVLGVLLYIYLKIEKSNQTLKTLQKYYKYCPECDFGINYKNPEIYCECGTKYLEYCPKSN